MLYEIIYNFIQFSLLGLIIIAFLFLLSTRFVTSLSIYDRLLLKQNNEHKIIYSIQTNEIKTEADQFPTIFHAGTVDLSIVINFDVEVQDITRMMMKANDLMIQKKSEDPEFTWEFIVIDTTDFKINKNPLIDITQKFDNITYIDIKETPAIGFSHFVAALNCNGMDILIISVQCISNLKDLKPAEEKLESLLQNNDSAIVIGKRNITKIFPDETTMEIILKFIIEFECSRFNLNISSDPFCPFILLTRDAARAMLTNLHIDGDCGLVELVTLAENNNIGIDEVSVTWDGAIPTIAETRRLWRICLGLLQIPFYYYTELWFLQDRSEFIPESEV